MSESPTDSVPTSPTSSTSACSGSCCKESHPSTPTSDTDTATESTAYSRASSPAQQHTRVSPRRCSCATGLTAQTATTSTDKHDASSTVPSPPTSPMRPASKHAAEGSTIHRTWRWCPEMCPLIWANAEQPTERRLPKELLGVLLSMIGQTCPHERLCVVTETGLDMWMQVELCRDCGRKLRVLEQGPFFC
eukprot:TRINITY_DN6666_c2_g1_i1.p2 TRINITY_DN6666_c2_g1~~TRINITY_DN6666_c2_g1_i1.p2  ORF type:complete len:191 (+),score=57.52 TRINITY_DN6666_c2_g1_i1:110-682(+)